MPMEIIIAVVGSGLTMAIALFMRYIAKRDKKADERQAHLVEQWAVEKCYTDHVGELATVTAKAAHREKFVNGDVGKLIEKTEEARDARNNFYREMNARMAMKE